MGSTLLIMKNLIYILFLFPVFTQAQIDSTVKKVAAEEAKKETDQLRKEFITLEIKSVTTKSTAMVPIDTLYVPINRTAIFVYDLIVYNSAGSETAKKEISIRNNAGVYSILSDYNTRGFSAGPIPALWYSYMVPGKTPVLLVGNATGATFQIQKQIIQ